MLRRPLISLSHSGSAKRFVTGFPVARRVVRRFVAGETQADAIGALRQLNREGLLATTDYLGEHVTEREAAQANLREYLSVLQAMAANDLQSGVSLKLSAMGLHIDEAFCYDNVRQIVAAAGVVGRFVRIDMEESALVDTTLGLYRRLRKDYDNVGTVVQAYLFRTQADVQALIDEGIADLRLVKGAYDEPASIAWRDRPSIQQQMIELGKMLLTPEARERGARMAMGSHDDVVYDALAGWAAEQGIDPQTWEIQFLYGIRRDEQKRLVEAGHRMRIYVPYGQSWYPYFMRRLAERPANLVFFLRALAGD